MTRIHPNRGTLGLFVAFCCGAVTASAQLPPGQVFGDVPQTDPEYAATTTLFQLGMSKGCNPTPDFCPTEGLLRADMAALIVRAWSARVFNDPEAFQSQTQTSAYFSDVPFGNPQFIYVQKLYELGITSGTVSPTINPSTGQLTAQGLYAPNDYLENVQIAIFLARARNLADYGCMYTNYGGALKPFTTYTTDHTYCVPNGFPVNLSEAPYFSDVCSPTQSFSNCPQNPSEPYFNYVQRLGDLSVFEPPSSVAGYQGCGSCVFGEGTTITRAQAAIWIVTAMQLLPESVLNMNTPGTPGGPNVWSTLPTITVAFTFTLSNQTYNGLPDTIQFGQFLLQSSNSGDAIQGPLYCEGNWATADLNLLQPTVQNATGYNNPLANTFCTVSLVSVTPVTNGTQAIINFTFAPIEEAGTYNVFHEVIYSQGQDPWENVGTLTVQASGQQAVNGPPQYQPPPDAADAPVGATATGMAYNCSDASGVWTDSVASTWTLYQSATQIVGPSNLYDPYNGGTTYSVVGTVSGGVVSLTATNPNPSYFYDEYEDLYFWDPELTITGWSLTGCVNGMLPRGGTGTETDYPNSGSTYTAAVRSDASPAPRAYSNTFTGQSNPPTISVTVDPVAGTVQTSLSGALTVATLTTSITGGNSSQTTQLGQHASQGQTTGQPIADSLQLGTIGLAAAGQGQYGTVTVTWGNVTATVTPTFYVVGPTHFTQYNAPYSNDPSCSASPQVAHVFFQMDANSCYYDDVSVPGDFLSQVELNGTGVIPPNHVVKAYSAGNSGICKLTDPGLTGSNTLFAMDTGGNAIPNIIGSNNTVLSDATGNPNPLNNNNPQTGSVAVMRAPLLPGQTTRPNYPAPPFVFKDQIVLVNGNNAPDARGPRSVVDFCPACDGGFTPPTTVEHIDTYNSSQVCHGVPDYSYSPLTPVRLR